MNITKTCVECKVEKSWNEFHKDSSRKSGFRPNCKTCQNIRVNKYCLAYKNARRRYDPEFKLLTNLRSRLRAALKGKPKSRSLLQLIGIDFETFTKWIDFQLEEGMTKE